MSVPGVTPSQTVGPFFHPCLLREPSSDMAGPSTAGERIRIEGQVRDGDGNAVSDAVIELWQANSHGRYNHPADTRPLPLDQGFSGFGRVGTDAAGRYSVETVKPGRVPFDSDMQQAPHIAITVLARGLLSHLFTRLYFSDEAEANAADPLLHRVPAERRTTLIAPRSLRDGRPHYCFDIVLQGACETVFFNV